MLWGLWQTSAFSFRFLRRGPCLLATASLPPAPTASTRTPSSAAAQRLPARRSHPIQWVIGPGRAAPPCHANDPRVARRGLDCVRRFLGVYFRGGSPAGPCHATVPGIARVMVRPPRFACSHDNADPVGIPPLPMAMAGQGGG